MKYGIVGNRVGWEISEVVTELVKLGITSKDTIISGGAEGVDSFAQIFAKQIGCKMVIFYPDKQLPIPARYMLRNRKIAEECDVLIAFNRYAKSGTKHTILEAKALNKKVIEFNKG